MTAYIQGTWGRMEPPAILLVTAKDTRATPPGERPFEDGLSKLDIINVYFTAPTSMPPVSTKNDLDKIVDVKLLIGCCDRSDVCKTWPADCKEYLYNDQIFVGSDYTGSWLSSTHLLITIIDATLSTSGEEEGELDGIKKESYFAKMDYENWMLVVVLKTLGSPLRSADMSSYEPIDLKGCIFRTSPFAIPSKTTCPIHLCLPGECPRSTGTYVTDGTPITGQWGPETVEPGFKGLLFQATFGLFLAMVLVCLVLGSWKGVMSNGILPGQD